LLDFLLSRRPLVNLCKLSQPSVPTSIFDGGRLGYSAAIGKSTHSVQFAVMALQNESVSDYLIYFHQIQMLTFSPPSIVSSSFGLLHLLKLLTSFSQSFTHSITVPDTAKVSPRHSLGDGCPFTSEGAYTCSTTVRTLQKSINRVWTWIQSFLTENDY
jgi:hypothetical protein